jgi:hypothetical protein
LNLKEKNGLVGRFKPRLASLLCGLRGGLGRGGREGGRKPIFRNHFKTYLLVILNEVKDIELVENTRFFASLRMTFWVNLRF